MIIPHTTSLELWDITMVTRLHRLVSQLPVRVTSLSCRFSLTPDATFLVWRKDLLVVAPLYSGVVQVP